MFTRERFQKITGGHTALYSLMPIENIPSVMEHGILSHELAKKYNHESIALETVQERREKKVTNTGRPLHSYANVYFDAHNPMLSRVRDKNNEICILAVDPEILNINGVIVTDCNAAASITQFVEPERMEEVLDFGIIYKRYWTDPNEFIQDRNKLIKCAEVLVPDLIPPEYIIGAVVANSCAADALKGKGFNLRIVIERDRFF